MCSQFKGETTVSTTVPTVTKNRFETTVESTSGNAPENTPAKHVDIHIRLLKVHKVLLYFRGKLYANVIVALAASSELCAIPLHIVQIQMYVAKCDSRKSIHTGSAWIAIAIAAPTDYDYV